MFYVSLLGIWIGMLFFRMLKNGVVGLYDWKEKLLHYIALPVIISFATTGLFTLFMIEWQWNIFMSGMISVGILMQYTVIKKREKYYQKMDAIERDKEQEEDR